MRSTAFADANDERNQQRAYAFVLELTTFAPAPVRHTLHTSDPTAVYARIVGATGADMLINVYKREPAANRDLDGLVVCLNQRRGNVWYLTDHEEQAYELQPPAQTEADRTFCLEDGSRMTVAASDTLSRSAALAAVAYWLTHGTRPPGVLWNEGTRERVRP